MRALVNDLPVWGLSLLFVGGLMLVALAGFLLVHHLDFRSPSTGADTMVSAFSGKATALFGILLVFVIVAEFNHFNDAKGTAQRESSALAEIARDSGPFPAGVQRAIRSAVAAYGNEVVHDEWPQLGRTGKPTARALELLVTVLLDYPFSGSLAISPAPFREGVLAQLIRP
jgi:hypothetical protein